MAKNDMEVIMYKILVYLYECMKEGRAPQLEDYGWESKVFSINEPYWTQIIQEMARMDLITGVRVTKTKDGPLVSIDSPMITFEGRRFLQENSMMQKVRDAIGEAFRVALSGIFGHII